MTIKRRTTLILGAGASVPFGFPTARQLVFDVCLGLAPGEPIHKALVENDHDESEITEFRSALIYSQPQSVDAFIEKRGEFILIGKRAIAAALIPRENPDDLLKRRQEKTWYEYLLERLTEGPLIFQNNQLNIVTFNYDRSLEYFLFITLKNTYGFSDERTAKEIRETLPIIHVYGNLGDLPELADKGRPYGSKADPRLVREAADALKIIPEAGDSLGKEFGAEFMRAREILRQSEMVCFLGFGYGQTNLRRLFGPNTDEWKDFKFYGSAYRLTAQEQRVFGGMLPGRNQPTVLEDLDCLQFLRTHVILL